MILSDRSIRDAIESGRIVIDPYDPALVQPCSIDIRLGNRFLEPIEDEGGHTFIDPTWAVQRFDRGPNDVRPCHRVRVRAARHQQCVSLAGLPSGV